MAAFLTAEGIILICENAVAACMCGVFLLQFFYILTVILIMRKTALETLLS